MMLSKDQIKSIIESILFVSDEPIPFEKMLSVLEDVDKKDIKEALDELSLELSSTLRGVVLCEVAGGYQLRTSPENSNYIFRLNKLKPAKLSKAAIETLSIIAYRQPVTKQEIESIRGVDSGWTVKTLLEKSLVKIIGKKDEPGNPLLYSTTKNFLEFFNLKSLDELPTLKEYHELAQFTQDEREPELNFDEDKENSDPDKEVGTVESPDQNKELPPDGAKDQDPDVSSEEIQESTQN